MTASRQFLYQYLKGRVYRGKLGVPFDKDSKFPKVFFSDGTSGNSRVVYLTDADEIAKSNEFMKENFYTSAIVPVALKLAKYHPGIIEQELDMMYHTTAFKDTETGETMGYAKFNIWNARPEYDSFDVDAKTWMHVGTGIANEMAATEEEAMSIWRDYQYQLYYHLSQKLAKAWKRDKIFYVGIGFIKAKYRNRPVNILTMSQSIMFTSLPKHFCTIFGITLHQHREIMLQNTNGTNIQEFGYIPYDSIALKWDGKLAFEGLKGGISFFGTLGQK